MPWRRTDVLVDRVRCDAPPIKQDKCVAGAKPTEVDRRDVAARVIGTIGGAVDLEGPRLRKVFQKLARGRLAERFDLLSLNDRDRDCARVRSARDVRTGDDHDIRRWIRRRLCGSRLSLGKGRARIYGRPNGQNSCHRTGQLME